MVALFVSLHSLHAFCDQMIIIPPTGKAWFASCSNTTPSSCSHPHHLKVTAWRDMFDTRIKYTGSGNSHKKQTMILLQMFKGAISEQNLQYKCINAGIYRDKPCLSKGRIGVVQVTDHKFDMNLTLHDAAPNDAGVYIVQVEVVNPDSSEVSSFSKTFEVYMIGKS